MLTTLIYRSQLNLSCSSAELSALVEKARIRNTGENITGILLSNGSDVLQLLEGKEESVVKLFHKIRDDERHAGVVELMRDYGPRRRFDNVGMLLFVLLAVFIAGLMIGRTPEYLGKKIDVREMKLTALAILVTPALVLIGTALALMTDAGRSGIFNPGIHGFSEVLYAVSSAANNNGSAFAGLSANSPFWNCLLAFCMFVGRFGVIVPVMAIAGALVSKKIQPTTTGTLPTHGALFIGLLIGTVLLVGALTFIPALALGPVAETLSLR